MSSLILYHGTGESVARRALVGGLSPRSARGQKKGKWSHTIESHPDLVYLTDIYAPYFAGNAAKENERWAILKLDCSALPKENFYPDEDFIAEVFELEKKKPRTQASMRKATRLAKRAMGLYQPYGRLWHGLERQVADQSGRNGGLAWYQQANS
jgi:hypothetical protein